MLKPKPIAVDATYRAKRFGKRSYLDWLFERVEKRPDGCWWWTGRTRTGYGTTTAKGRFLRVHRLVYHLMVGPIPDDLVIDHLCRNPLCVNPAHLEPVPSTVNVLRGVGPTAVNARKETCPRGHAYDTVRNGGRSRWCLECERLESREAARRKAEREGRIYYPRPSGRVS